MEKINFSDYKINDEEVEYINHQDIHNFSFNKESIEKYAFNRKEIIFNNCSFNGKENTIRLFDNESCTLKTIKICFNSCFQSMDSLFYINDEHSSFIDSISLNFYKSVLSNFSYLTQKKSNIRIEYSLFSNCTIGAYFDEVYLSNSIGLINIVNWQEINSSRIDVRMNQLGSENEYQIHADLFDLIKSKDINFKDNIAISKLTIAKFGQVVFLKDNEIYDDRSAENFKLYTSIISGTLPTKVYIDNHHFEELRISGQNNDSEYMIQNSTFKKVEFKNLTANVINLYNINPFRNSDELEFNLIDVKFNKGKFEIVDLSRINKSLIQRTIIEHLTMISASFPSKIDFKLPEEDFDEAKLAYEFYRQLKTAFQRNNNTIQALEAHSKMFEAARNRNDLSDGDKFILHLNHFSNRNGISIVHALKTIILIVVISFLVLTLSSYVDSKNCISTWFEKNIFGKSEMLFSILNPISRIDEFKPFLNDQDPNFFQHLIIFSTKIGIAWGFYQFVAAFRKFGKN